MPLSPGLLSSLGCPSMVYSIYKNAAGSTTASFNLTLCDDVMDMTPPSQGVIFPSPQDSMWRSLPCSKVSCNGDHRHPTKGPVSANPTVWIPRATDIFKNPSGPQQSPQPTVGRNIGPPQNAALPRAPVLSGFPLLASSVHQNAAGSTANFNPSLRNDALATIPPSQSVIFRSPPDSMRTLLSCSKLGCDVDHRHPCDVLLCAVPM